MRPFFNPTIYAVTFRLHAWCILGVFLLPAFTHLGCLLLLLCRTLDGDACRPHEGGCPPQLLQVAIELVPQKGWFQYLSCLIASCSGQCCSRRSAVMMSALHGHISDSPTLNLLYMWALSLLCPVLNLNRITCSVLFSLWRLTGCSLGVAASIFSWRGF